MQSTCDSRWKRWLANGLVASLLLVSATGGFAQKSQSDKANSERGATESDNDSADRALERGSSEKGAAKKEAKSRTRGRLPAYFSEVVSQEQRDEIYALQEDFAEQIRQLQDQIMELQTKRDEAIQAVLTDEQRERVARLAANSKSGRKSKSEKGAAAKSDSEKTAGEKPAEETSPGDETN